MLLSAYSKKNYYILIQVKIQTSSYYFSSFPLYLLSCFLFLIQNFNLFQNNDALQFTYVRAIRVYNTCTVTKMLMEQQNMQLCEHLRKSWKHKINRYMQ